MENKEELISNLKEREEYLEGEWYQLFDLADKMGGVVALEDSNTRDAKDLLTAFNATWEVPAFILPLEKPKTALRRRLGPRPNKIPFRPLSRLQGP